MTYAAAVRRALIEAAQCDPAVIFMAEGAHDPAAVFGTLPTPADGIDASRIIEMPTSENAIVGAAIGAAMAGKRPVVSFHRVEFALLAMEQIVNNAAKLAFISNGRHSAPLLLRLVIGRGWGQGPVHAQSLEAVFAAVPGLRVAMPATPADAYAMTRQALCETQPTVLIEHRWCHGLEAAGDIRAETGAAFDGPRHVATGSALTIVATGYMVTEARRAETVLRRLGYPSDVIDLRVLRPLNVEPILRSVERTHKLLTVDTGHVGYGIGAEVVARCAEADGPLLLVRRLGADDRPVASSRNLMAGYYPDARQIFHAATGMLGISINEQLDAATLMDELPPASDQPDADFRGPF